MHGTDRMTSFRGTLTGTVDQRGLVALQGMLRDSELGSLETNPWRFQLDDAGHLKGSFLLTNRFTNIYGQQVVEYRYTDVDTVR